MAPAESTPASPAGEATALGGTCNFSTFFALGSQIDLLILEMSEITSLVAGVLNSCHHTVGIHAGYFIHRVFSIVTRDLAVKDSLFDFMGPRDKIFN